MLILMKYDLNLSFGFASAMILDGNKTGVNAGDLEMACMPGS